MAPIYHPLTVLEKRKPNARVKLPFKHHQGQVSLQDDFDPGEGFKALSALATWQVAQFVGREPPVQGKKKYGQLWKGRLKPLYPVRVDGPDITQCQGVMPRGDRPDASQNQILAKATNRVTVSPSRQQQRRRAAHQLAHAAQGGVAYRPRTVESVHNTSRASSPFTEERDTVMKGPSDLSTRSKLAGSATTPTLIGTSLVHFQYVTDDLSSVRSGSVSAHESIRHSPSHAGGGARPSPRLLTTRPQTAPSHLKPRVRFADNQSLRVRVQSAGVRASEDATAGQGVRPASARSSGSRGSRESGRMEAARVVATDGARPASMDSVREGIWQRTDSYVEERPTSAEPMEIEVRGESIPRPGSAGMVVDESRKPTSLEMQKTVSKESIERPRSQLGDEALERPVSAQSVQSSHSSLQSAGSVTLQALRRDSADSHASGDAKTSAPEAQKLNAERQKEVDLLSEKGIVIRPLSTSRMSFRMDTPWPEDLDPNARPFSGSKILARQGTPVQEGQGEMATQEQGQGDASEGRLETDSRKESQDRRKNSVTFAAGIPLPESRESEMEMKSRENSDLAESGLSKPEMTLEEMAEQPLPESRTESVKSFASAKSMPERSLKKESEVGRHSEPRDVAMEKSDVTLDANVIKPEVEESEITVFNIDRPGSAASDYAADVESTKSATTQPIFSVPPTRDWEAKLGVVQSAGISRTTTKTDGRLSQSANSRTTFPDPREMSSIALLPNLQTTETSSYATTTDIPSSPDQREVRISEKVEEIPKKPVEVEMSEKMEKEDDVRRTEASRAESTISTLSATSEPTKFGSYIPSAPRGSIRSASRQETETPGKDRSNRTHSGMGSRTDDEDLLIDYDVGSDVTSLNLDEDEDFLDSGASPIEYDDEAIMGTKRSYDDTIEERSSEMSTPKNPSRAKSDISDPVIKTDPTDQNEKADEAEHAAEADPEEVKSEACQDDFKEVASKRDEDDDKGPGDHVTRDQTYVTSQVTSQSEPKSLAQSEGVSENEGSGSQQSGGQNDGIMKRQVQHGCGGFRALRRPLSAKTSPPKMPTPRRSTRPQSAKPRKQVKNSSHSAKSRPAASKSRPSSSKVSRPKSASSADIDQKMEYLQIIATPCRSSKPESRVCSYCGQKRNEFVESSNTSRFCICSLCYKKHHENETNEDKMWKIQDSFVEKVTTWESGPKVDQNETSLDEEEKNLGVYDDSDSGHESESEYNESESTFENESNYESESGWVSEHIGNVKSRMKMGQRRTSIENGKTVLLPYEVEKLKMKVNQKSSVTSEDAEVTKKDCLELTSKKLERDAQPSLPPVAPLCFRITHSPPEGFLFYFAYGLDLNKNRMSMYTGRQMDRSMWGVLFGFKLCFNKRVSDLSCGGFPTVTSEQGQSVEGTVYLITKDELKMMDRFVGYPEHYHHVMLPVWACNSPAPAEHGVAQYCLPSLLYVARDEWLCDVTTTGDDVTIKHGDVTGGLDCSGSVRQCLKYGDGLTDKYREHLERLVKA